jgi:hypothetical protein
MDAARARLGSALAALIIALPLAASADPVLLPDPTGLWFVPEEAGWGMSVTQQGDTEFVVLFAYDDSRRATWYVASDVKFNGVTVLPSNEPVFTGTLYRTSGPPPGPAFDRNAVSATPVGDIQLNYVATPGGKSLAVAYSVDGVRVFKTLQPQTWRDGSAKLAGRFSGGVLLQPDSPSTCPELSHLVLASLVTLNVSTTLRPGNVSIIWGTGTDTGCELAGPYVQRGQLASVSGRLLCGPVPAFSDFGAMQLAEVAVTDHGFTAQASLQRNGCSYTGTLGGVRQP